MSRFEFDLYQKDTILIVDDDPTNLRALQEILKTEYKVFAATSGEKALLFLENKIPGIVLLDVEMSGMDGYQVMERMKCDSRWENIPVIFLTAQGGREKEQLALKKGAVDYIRKPIFAEIVRSRVGLRIQLENYKHNLEKMVEQKTEELRRTQDTILDILCSVTAYRDNETGAHIKRTTGFVELLINDIIKAGHPKYKVSQNQAMDIIKSSKLHDIGKIAIPDGILFKPARLSKEEFDIIKSHTTIGASLIDDAIKGLNKSEASSSFLNMARTLVISHHERWDGNGYPNKLAGHDIPLAGRVMAIADVYDALISARPYKIPMTHAEAMEIILKSFGNHFDPNILEMCPHVFDKFTDIYERYKD